MPVLGHPFPLAARERLQQTSDRAAAFLVLAAVLSVPSRESLLDSSLSFGGVPPAPLVLVLVVLVFKLAPPRLKFAGLVTVPEEHAAAAVVPLVPGAAPLHHRAAVRVRNQRGEREEGKEEDEERALPA